MSKVAIYADINPNIIDGSSIWMMSITETMSRVFDEVWLILKTQPVEKQLISSLSDLTNVVIDYEENAGEEPLTRDIAQSVDRLQELHHTHQFDALIVRGIEACNACCYNVELAKILWAYVTDLPFPIEKLSQNGKNRLERIALRSRGLFSQTESSRSYFEALAPSATGKTYLLPPMIPQSAFVDKDPRETNTNLELVYAGKLARDWKTLEMLDLPAALQEVGIDAHLTVVGEKINKDRSDATWHVRMKARIESAKQGEIYGVTALGALPRSEAIDVIRRADLGIGWRTARLDSSLEISTKALEYSAAGVPVLINRNSDHEQLFGEDYPLFLTADMDVKALANHIAETLSSIGTLENRVKEVATHYSMDAAVTRLTKIFDRAGILNYETSEGASAKSRNVLMVSHDLKFAGDLITELEKNRSINLMFDHWDSLHSHDESESKRLAQAADVIFCEFAGPNLAYFSKHVEPHQKLIARLHGFEVRNKAPWFKEINFDAVDAVVTVSQRYKELAEEFLPELIGKISVIPNMVDCVQFQRPKLPGAEFHLGMIGMVPFLKRPDKAIDLIEALATRDERFYLHIKSRMPWDYPYVWKDDKQRHAYVDTFRRIYESEMLKNHVIFEPFSTDVASWFRGIGTILSPSDEESFHLAPAEGAASGCAVYIWDRPGASEIFGSDRVFSDEESILEHLLSSPPSATARKQMKRWAAERWDSSVIMPLWDSQLMN